MNTAKQIRLFLTLSPQENDRLLAAYTAYVMEEGDHVSGPEPLRQRRAQTLRLCGGARDILHRIHPFQILAPL